MCCYNVVVVVLLVYLLCLLICMFRRILFIGWKSRLGQVQCSSLVAWQGILLHACMHLNSVMLTYLADTQSLPKQAISTLCTSSFLLLSECRKRVSPSYHVLFRDVISLCCSSRSKVLPWNGASHGKFVGLCKCHYTYFPPSNLWQPRLSVSQMRGTQLSRQTALRRSA